MSATARCPHCSKTVATPPDWDGAIFPCPSCGGKVGLLDSVGPTDFASASPPPSDERYTLVRPHSRNIIGIGVLLRPLLGIVMIFCFIAGLSLAGWFCEPESVGAQEPGLLGLMHLLPAAWAGLVVWWTRRHETWMCTSRGAWLIGMGLAYALGLGTGICVSVFN